ncbi:MAG TPA: asparagine synthase (glutamine-hydrolyzing), partial [Deinococcales bacterium]|nr:asparagine synthase (glutamine-hydrolyzing) [Deinococcales bacterium]
MASIAGIFALHGTASRAELLGMAAEQQGPAEVAGLMLDGNFGMTATTPTEPLHSHPGGQLHLVLDGHIYNAPDLRETLGLAPEATQEQVILHAFERWGPQAPERFNGDFAFAIWDSGKRCLFLARDRFGTRPLFLLHDARGLAFASSTRALIGLPGVSRELSPVAVAQTFQLWATLPGRSAFRDVTELPAGYWLQFDEAGRPVRERWWDLDFSEQHAETDATQLSAELLDLLTDAVRIRSRDNPGAYVSGGLDSSATTALLKQHGKEPPAGFAVGFSDAVFDETPEQDHLAAALGLELDRVTVTDAYIAEAFPDVVAQAERPLLRTAPAPLLRLARHAAGRGAQAVLTGEGADELFGGYAIFKELAVRRFWARQPDSELRPLLFARLNPYLAQDLTRAGRMLGNYYGADLLNTDDALYSHSNRFRNGQRNLRFLEPEVLAAASDPEEDLRALLPDGFSQFGPLGRAQYLEVRTFMEGYLLPSQADRMFRAAGLEGRFPFLDHRLAEFAARLPERLRLKGL